MFALPGTVPRSQRCEHSQPTACPMTSRTLHNDCMIIAWLLCRLPLILAKPRPGQRGECQGSESETQELPAFITMNLHTDGMQLPQAAG